MDTNELGNQEINNRKLIEITSSLRRMTKKAHIYLENYEQSADWKRYREAFLSLNFPFKLTEIVDFKTCDLEDPETAYFIPKKNKIIACSNKIYDQNHMNSLLNYQLTLMYDTVRANIDWTNCKQIACMHIRAMNISGHCKRKNKECFKQNLDNLLFNKLELCKNKQDIFDKTFDQCIVDISPINTIKNRQGYLI